MGSMDHFRKTVIKEYWLKKLSGELPEISLPFIDNINRDSAAARYAGSTQLEIPRRIYDKLKRVARNADIGLFILFLSGLNIILNRYTAVEDLIVATVPPAADVGHNSIIFCRNHVSPRATVKEIIAQTKQEVAEVVDYAELSLDEILEELREKRNGDDPGILSIASIYEPFQKKCASLDRFDLRVVLSGTGSRTALELEYSSAPGPHSQEIAGKFSRNLITILDRMPENPDQELALMDIVSEEEKNQLLYDFNNTAAEYPKNKTITRLFEEQAAKTPDAAAVIAGEQGSREISRTGPRFTVTYNILNEKANQLAVYLKEKGAGRETIAAVLMDRSVEMIAVILGILKAGGTYLPLDPAHPAERNAYMLEHSAARLLLTRRDLNEGITTRCEVIDVPGEAPRGSETGNPDRAAAPTDLAYVIYTSGSTGKPKGVMIQHNSVVNFINAFTDIIPFNRNDHILSLTTVTFDIFGLETLLPLTIGAKVVLGNWLHQLNIAAAAVLMNEECITIFQATPSHLHLFVEAPEAANSLRSLKCLLVGGEVFPEPLLEKAKTLTQGKIYNLYGPTETTIWSAVKNVSGRRALNIGKPIANTRIYIIDRSGLLQPMGVPGELCIAGDGLARGYLNQPQLTANRFNRFNRSYKSYRTYISYKTGDLARWLPDGNIEFLGRMDHQVKIRGFRIELVEIENQLQTHRKIKEAVVTVRDTGPEDKYLCAYVVPHSTEFSESLNVAELREFLSRKLPDYMIPSYFVLLEKMPLTPNGKLDRKALPREGGLLVGTGVSYVPPETAIEKNIAQLWQEVLKREEQVGMEDNFFDMGGNSFKLIQLNKRLNEVLETAVPLMTLFRYPTIRSLMEYLNNEQVQDTVTDAEIDESLSYMDKYINMWETDTGDEN